MAITSEWKESVDMHMAQTKAVLDGAVVNGKRHIGLVERVQNIDDRHDRQDRTLRRILYAVWAVAGAIIAAVAAAIIEDLWVVHSIR